MTFKYLDRVNKLLSLMQSTLSSSRTHLPLIHRLESKKILPECPRTILKHKYTNKKIHFIKVKRQSRGSFQHYQVACI